MGWMGKCNGCGACCQSLVAGELFRCEHLLTFDKVGRAGATACAVYADRTLGMPIHMRSSTSSFKSHCLTIYPRAKDAVPPECSYKWAGDEPQPLWSITYAPTF